MPGAGLAEGSLGVRLQGPLELVHREGRWEPRPGWGQREDHVWASFPPDPGPCQAVPGESIVGLRAVSSQPVLAHVHKCMCTHARPCRSWLEHRRDTASHRQPSVESHSPELLCLGTSWCAQLEETMLTGQGLGMWPAWVASWLSTCGWAPGRASGAVGRGRRVALQPGVELGWSCDPEAPVTAPRPCCLPLTFRHTQDCQDCAWSPPESCPCFLGPRLHFCLASAPGGGSQVTPM